MGVEILEKSLEEKEGLNCSSKSNEVIVLDNSMQEKSTTPASNGVDNNGKNDRPVFVLKVKRKEKVVDGVKEVEKMEVDDEPVVLSERDTNSPEGKPSTSTNPST